MNDRELSESMDGCREGVVAGARAEATKNLYEARSGRPLAWTEDTVIPETGMSPREAAKVVLGNSATPVQSLLDNQWNAAFVCGIRANELPTGELAKAITTLKSWHDYRSLLSNFCGL